MLVTIPGVILHLTSESELDLDLVNGDPRVGDPAAAPLTPDGSVDRFAGPISLEGVPPSLQSHPPFFLQIMSSMCCATSVIATGTFDFRAKILTVCVQRCYKGGILFSYHSPYPLWVRLSMVYQCDPWFSVHGLLMKL